MGEIKDRKIQSLPFYQLSIYHKTDLSKILCSHVLSVVIQQSKPDNRNDWLGQ